MFLILSDWGIVLLAKKVHGEMSALTDNSPYWNGEMSPHPYFMGWGNVRMGKCPVPDY